MKNRMAIILFLTILCSIVVYSQVQENPQAEIYLGLSVGFSPIVFGHSSYWLDLGGQIFYTFNNQYFSFSYNRVNSFNLKFDSNEKDDDSNMDRVELLYGRISCLKEGHKLFSRIYVGVLIGLSYNSIRYYSDQIAYDQGHAIIANQIGIPFGITLSNSFGHSIFGCMEMKYHFIPNGFSYFAYKYDISFNLH